MEGPKREGQGVQVTGQSGGVQVLRTIDCTNDRQDFSIQSAKVITAAKQYKAVIGNFTTRFLYVIDMAVACWQLVYLPG